MFLQSFYWMEGVIEAPCLVCGATTRTGLHYGAITCYPCRAFFRWLPLTFDKLARKAVLIKIHDIAFVPWHNVLLKKFVSIGSANSEIKIRQKKLMTQNRKVRTQAAFFKGESLWYSSKPESTSNVCKCCCRPCGLPDNAQYDRNTIRLLLEYL